VQKNPLVVVGAGQAGLQVCDSVRKGGYDGHLVLIGEESSLPYQRPPLSKKYLTGTVDEQRLTFRPVSFYEKNQIELRLNERIEALDCIKHNVIFAGGKTLNYEKLVLTTGSRVRPLRCDGADLPGVFYIRTLTDARALCQRLAKVDRVAVIGGGFIGLEAAAMARELQKTVVLFETTEHLMGRAVSAFLSDFYAELHREHGVELHLGCSVNRIRRQKNELVLETETGTEHRADILVVGIGVIPNVELAENAELECRDGILVDEYGRTSDPDIFSAGDCTMHYNGFLGREVRLESVQNAVDQAKIVAGNLFQKGASYTAVPWFWSDQYDAKLQIAGLGMSHDEFVVRGEVKEEGFSLFYFRKGILLGADSINRPADHMACRKILENRIDIRPSEAGDLNFDLRKRSKIAG